MAELSVLFFLIFKCFRRFHSRIDKRWLSYEISRPRFNLWYLKVSRHLYFFKDRFWNVEVGYLILYERFLHKPTYTHIHTFKCLQKYTHAHPFTHTHKQINKYTYTRTYTYIVIKLLTNTHMNKHWLKHIYTNKKYIHTQKNTHTHISTHTHKFLLISSTYLHK